MKPLNAAILPTAAVLSAVLAGIFPQLLRPLDFMIVPLLAMIMLGMGTTLSLQDFNLAIRQPRAVLIGMMLQFLLMPFLAYIASRICGLDKDQTIGLVMVGCVSGGTASNVITYLAGGNVALSITMTACSTVAGIVLTPLLAQLYLAQTVAVPVWAMFQNILLVVALPVSLGLLINHFLRQKNQILQKICPIFSTAGIVLVIGIVVSLNAQTMQSCTWRLLLAVLLHNLSGMASGYALARVLRCDKKTAITIAIEVGMQNSGLAAALSKIFFSTAATLPGAIFSVWHNISGAIFAALVRRKLQKNADNDVVIKDI